MMEEGAAMLRARSRSRGRSYSDPPRPMDGDLGPFSASCTLPISHIGPPIDLFIRRSKDYSLKRDTEEDIGVEGAKWVSLLANELADKPVTEDDWEIVAIETTGTASDSFSLLPALEEKAVAAYDEEQEVEEVEEDDEECHEHQRERGVFVLEHIEGTTPPASNSGENSTELESATCPSVDSLDAVDSPVSFTPDTAGEWDQQQPQQQEAGGGKHGKKKDSSSGAATIKDSKKANKKAKKAKDKDKAKKAKKKERKAGKAAADKLSPRELAHLVAAKTNNLIGGGNSAGRPKVPPIHTQQAVAASASLSVGPAPTGSLSDRDYLSRSRIHGSTVSTSSGDPPAGNARHPELLGASGSISERSLSMRQPLHHAQAHNWDNLPERQKTKIQKVLGVVPERSHTKLMKLLGEDMPLAASGPSLGVVLPEPSSRVDVPAPEKPAGGEAEAVYHPELERRDGVPVHRKRSRSISWSYFLGAATDDDDDETTEEEQDPYTASSPSSPQPAQPSWFAAFQKRLTGADAAQGHATYRIRRKRSVSDARKAASQPGRGDLDDDGGGTIIISSPANARQMMNIDFRWEWTGGDPVSQFEFSAKLGQGAYGKVYKAKHKETDFLMAIKCINLDGISQQESRQLMKEIDVLKTCRSTHIVSYFSSCFRKNCLWIMMEYCGLGSVQDAMNLLADSEGEEEGSIGLCEEDIAYILKSVVSGLVYLHYKKIIHRDLKAGNILLTTDGIPKIADFGTAAQLRTASFGYNAIMGTPLFMAPEMLDGDTSDVKSDIWSVGITAIQMAQGRPPYHNLHPARAIVKICMDASPNLDDPWNWSEEFVDFISVCLNKTKEKRPSAAELLKHPFLATVPPGWKMDKLINKLQSARKTVNRKHSTAYHSQESVVDPFNVSPPFDLVAAQRRYSQSAATAQPMAGSSTIAAAQSALSAAPSKPPAAKPRGAASKKESRERDFVDDESGSGKAGAKKAAKEAEEKEVVRMNPLRAPVLSTSDSATPQPQPQPQQQLTQVEAAPRPAPTAVLPGQGSSSADGHEGNAGHVRDEPAQSTTTTTTATTMATLNSGSHLPTNLICDFVLCKEAIATNDVIRCLLLVPYANAGAGGSVLGRESNEQELRQWSVWGAADDGSLTVWKTSQGEPGRPIASAKQVHGGMQINALILVENRVWAALDDGAICVWNAKDQTFVKKLVGHTKSLRCLAEVQSGANSASFLGRKTSLVVSSGDDTKLCLWNARSLALKSTASIGTPVISLVAVPSALWLGTRDKEIIMLKSNKYTRKSLASAPREHVAVPNRGPTSMVYTGGRVWTTSDDNCVHVWEAVRGSAKRAQTLRVDGKVTCLVRVKNHVWGCGPLGIYLWHSTTLKYRGKISTEAALLSTMIQVSSSAVWSVSPSEPSILVWEITRRPSFFNLPPISQLAIPPARSETANGDSFAGAGEMDLQMTVVGKRLSSSNKLPTKRPSALTDLPRRATLASPDSGTGSSSSTITRAARVPTVKFSISDNDSGSPFRDGSGSTQFVPTPVKRPTLLADRERERSERERDRLDRVESGSVRQLFHHLHHNQAGGAVPGSSRQQQLHGSRIRGATTTTCGSGSGTASPPSASPRGMSTSAELEGSDMDPAFWVDDEDRHPRQTTTGGGGGHRERTEQEKERETTERGDRESSGETKARKAMSDDSFSAEIQRSAQSMTPPLVARRRRSTDVLYKWERGLLPSPSTSPRGADLAGHASPPKQPPLQRHHRGSSAGGRPTLWVTSASSSGGLTTAAADSGSGNNGDQVGTVQGGSSGSGSSSDDEAASGAPLAVGGTTRSGSGIRQSLLSRNRVPPPPTAATAEESTTTTAGQPQATDGPQPQAHTAAVELHAGNPPPALMLETHATASAASRPTHRKTDPNTPSHAALVAMRKRIASEPVAVVALERPMRRQTGEDEGLAAVTGLTPPPQLTAADQPVQGAQEAPTLFPDDAGQTTSKRNRKDSKTAKKKKKASRTPREEGDEGDAATAPMRLTAEDDHGVDGDGDESETTAAAVAAAVAAAERKRSGSAGKKKRGGSVRKGSKRGAMDGDSSSSTDEESGARGQLSTATLVAKRKGSAKEKPQRRPSVVVHDESDGEGESSGGNGGNGGNGGGGSIVASPRVQRKGSLATTSPRGPPAPSPRRNSSTGVISSSVSTSCSGGGGMSPRHHSCGSSPTPPLRALPRGLSKLQVVTSPRGVERPTDDCDDDDHQHRYAYYLEAAAVAAAYAQEQEDRESRDLVVLVRCAQLPEWGDDFSELSLSRECKTIDALREALASEFNVDKASIDRVRKLPNIVLCRDQHVMRLKGGESLEITLKPPSS